MVVRATTGSTVAPAPTNSTAVVDSTSASAAAATTSSTAARSFAESLAEAADLRLASARVLLQPHADLGDAFLVIAGLVLGQRLGRFANRTLLVLPTAELDQRVGERVSRLGDHPRRLLGGFAHGQTAFDDGDRFFGAIETDQRRTHAEQRIRCVDVVLAERGLEDLEAASMRRERGVEPIAR